jgi:3D (Asp-Asp-Asp) domain-containing protein
MGRQIDGVDDSFRGVKFLPAIFLAFSLVVWGLSGIVGGNNKRAAEGDGESWVLSVSVVLATESRFSEEVIEVGEKLPFATEVVVDTEKDACSEDEVRQEGQMGKRVKEVQVTYYDGEEYEREVIGVKTESPVTKIIAKGGKRIYKSMQTDSGTISYWCDLGKFKATAYDKTCPGCSATTAIGMPAGFGVVAVDPKVIPLGSRVYITGYGVATAGDTGGAIRGREVDLGFDSIGTWWGRREVEVYLL